MTDDLGPGMTAADAIGQAARAMDAAEPVRFIRHVGNDDVFHRGPASGGALIVVPGIWSAMPPDLLATMRARRRCAATGRCSECGACADLSSGRFMHESDCSVSDAHLRPLLAEWGRQVGVFARGRRILEDPT